MGSPLERDQLLCRNLGIVTARWGMMDEALCTLLGTLLEQPEVGRSAYFSTGSFRQRIELIRAVTNERLANEADKKSLLSLLTKIYKAFQVRNRLIHAHYVIVVEDERGELSYINAYFNDQVSIDEPKLKPLYVGRLDPSKEDGVARVNAGTFANHGDKLDDLIYEVVDMFDEIEDGNISVLN